jgi:hypothetical protein
MIPSTLEPQKHPLFTMQHEISHQSRKEFTRCLGRAVGSSRAHNLTFRATGPPTLAQDTVKVLQHGIRGFFGDTIGEHAQAISTTQMRSLNLENACERTYLLRWRCPRQSLAGFVVFGLAGSRQATVILFLL